MNRDETITVLARHADRLRERGVVRLALFGSVARDDAGPNSDVDVVVDIGHGRKFSIIDHASLRVLLCDLLGREADVVVEDKLRPRFRDRIARDRVEVF